MTDSAARLVEITLDQKSLLTQAPHIEHERTVAIEDLLISNSFDLLGEDVASGPYRLCLSVQDNRRLVFQITGVDGDEPHEIKLGLMSFRRIIKDYFLLCESYFNALTTLSPSQIETIDMARRGMHDEGAQLLIDLLKERIALDKLTARRLFTLIAVLHISG